MKLIPSLNSAQVGRAWLLASLVLSLTSCATRGPGAGTAGEARIPVKVVIVTLFEVDEDTGDKPGEFQYWVEREHLVGKHPVIGAWRPVREGTNGVIGICTGMGNIRSAASITALGLDARYDLSKAYWLVAGISGIDPADGTLGSAVWAEHIVDGDLAHEIDAREIPASWPDGYAPLGTAEPAAAPAVRRPEQVHYPLNPTLARWAYSLTQNTPLPDDEKMQFNRARYTGFPNAQRPPFVLLGDNLAGSTFWHGQRMNAWANRWVALWTEGRGNYVTTAMEESGTMQALTWLARDGKVDASRVLVLRTASNFDMPPPGLEAAASLAEENGGAYSAFIPSLESAHRVGSRVVHELVRGWKQFEQTPPKP
jgi:purine nucleoside permease